MFWQSPEVKINTYERVIIGLCTMSYVTKHHFVKFLAYCHNVETGFPSCQVSLRLEVWFMSVLGYMYVVYSLAGLGHEQHRSTEEKET